MDHKHCGFRSHPRRRCVMTSLFTKISRMPEEKRQRIKEALELLEGEPCLASKSNSSPDDRLGLYAQIEQLAAERDALLAACDSVIEWDKARGFLIPYPVRDLIQQAIAAARTRGAK